jgi:putative transposase
MHVLQVLEIMMKRKTHSPAQIVPKLTKADRLLADGRSVAEPIAELEVSQPTYHRCRKQYGSMTQSEAKKLKELKELKELKKENARLKRIVADQALDIVVLKEISEGGW